MIYEMHAIEGLTVNNATKECMGLDTFHGHFHLLSRKRDKNKMLEYTAKTRDQQSLTSKITHTINHTIKNAKIYVARPSFLHPWKRRISTVILSFLSLVSSSQLFTTKG